MDKSLTLLKSAVSEYYYEHGRHDLPWRLDVSTYSIVISEVMLQQTQVSRVREKYREFIDALPGFDVLASAPQAEVLRLWQGLGYNRRALRLKQLAEQVMVEHGGELPRDLSELQKLPGIGSNSAGSIAAFAFNSPVVFIETNIRRVFIHHCFADVPQVNDKQILPLIEQAMDYDRPREWYWALMDYGSYLATQIPNPNKKSKHYTKQSKFLGSDRQIRGEVLRLLLEQGRTYSQLTTGLAHLETNTNRIDRILTTLASEGFIKLQKNRLVIV